MNEKEIKYQIAKKYKKEISDIMPEREFLDMPLSQGIQTLSMIFESMNRKCPADILKYAESGSLQDNFDSNNDSNDNSDLHFQKAVHDSQEEFSLQQRSNSMEAKPLILPEFNLSKFRYLNTDENTAQQRNITCKELLEYRRDLTKNLANFDKITGVRYKDSILEELKKINNQPKIGITISVLLHTGDRINKIFDSEDIGSSVYYWTASQDKMIKDNIKPGHFIIIKNTGEEIIPDIVINEQINEKQILLNVRLL